ncbi:MAG: amidohydrolase family protein [Massiliimalia sp.]
MIIDAHVHLWDRQNGMVNHRPVTALTGGKSDFGGEIRQMMPPYMLDGRNTVEMLMANMDYAQVSGCVVTQEIIDGNQDAYLLDCKKRYGNRMKICCLYEEQPMEDQRADQWGDPWVSQFDGIKICGGRLSDGDLLHHAQVFEQADRLGKFISIDLAEGTLQTDAMQQLADRFPRLKMAVGHFGMVTVPGWEKQIELAKKPNVFIETGGITWLFHQEYYPYPSAVKAIRTAIEICGIDKLMWGSDYPRTMTAITYLMSRDFIEKSEELTLEEKTKLLGENAKDFYGFEKLDVPPRIRNMVE